MVIGGIAKQLAVPGWRVGWIMMYDPQGMLSEGDVSVRQGLRNLSQLILGANTLAQSAIPAMFPPAGHNTPVGMALDHYYKCYSASLEANASFLHKQMEKVPGVTMNHPHGSFFAMLQLDMSCYKDIIDDVDFSQRLLHEENAVVLPGSVFGRKDCVRVAFHPPSHILSQAVDRLNGFCHRHAKDEVGKEV